MAIWSKTSASKAYTQLLLNIHKASNIQKDLVGLDLSMYLILPLHFQKHLLNDGQPFIFFELINRISKVLHPRMFPYPKSPLLTLIVLLCTNLIYFTTIYWASVNVPYTIHYWWSNLGFSKTEPGICSGSIPEAAQLPIPQANKLPWTEPGTLYCSLCAHVCKIFWNIPAER